MPPKPGTKPTSKKDQGKGAGESKDNGAPKDEYDTMSVEQLQDVLHKTMTKFNELRRNRNFFQLERVRFPPQSFKLNAQ